jgi:hypothetical protein
MNNTPHPNIKVTSITVNIRMDLAVLENNIWLAHEGRYLQMEEIKHAVMTHVNNKIRVLANSKHGIASSALTFLPETPVLELDPRGPNSVSVALSVLANIPHIVVPEKAILTNRVYRMPLTNYSAAMYNTFKALTGTVAFSTLTHPHDSTYRIIVRKAI